MNRSDLIGLAAFLSLFVLASTFVGYRSPPQLDEPYTRQLAQALASGPVWHQIATYENTPHSVGPVFGGVFAIWGMVVQFEWPWLRFPSFITPLASGWAATILLRRTAWVAAVALPGYLLTLSFMAMSEGWLVAGLLVGLVGFVKRLEGKSAWWLALTVVGWTMMVDAKVSTLPVLVVAMAWLVFTKRCLIAEYAAVAFPVVVHLPFYVAWGGLLPPTQHLAFPADIPVHLGFRLSHIVHGCIVLGGVAWPVVFLQAVDGYWRQMVYVGLAISFFVFLGFYPDYSSFVYAGSVRSLLARFAPIPLAAGAITLPFYLFGVYACLRAAVFGGTAIFVREHRSALANMMFLVTVFCLAIPPVCWDRYAAPAVPLLVLGTMVRAPQAGWRAVLFCAWPLVIGVVYMFAG
jgi:hypothetical protein